MAELFDEVLAAREATYSKLVAPIKSYFDAVAEVFRGVNNFDPEDMYAKIDKAASMKMVKYPTENWFKGIITAIDTEEYIFSAYEKLVNVVRDDTIYDTIGRSISHTKMQKAISDRTFILTLWAEYAPARLTDNKIMLGNLTTEMVTRAQEEAFDYVTTRPLAGVSISILRQLLNSNLTDGRKKILRATVDTSLRALFSSAPLRNVGYLSLHGLVPATLSLPWDVVAGGLEITSKIVISYSSGSGVEFNIAGLIDADYIRENSLEVVDGAGLNKKIIKRFVTTRQFSAPKAQWSIEITGDGPYYVFETIAPGLFRLMRLAHKQEATPIPALSIIEGISARSEEYHREIGLSRPFDPAHRYIMIDIAARQPYVPSSELYDFVNKMQDSNISVKDFRESIMREAVKNFIDTFKHTTLLDYGSESMVSYLLHIEPIIETLKERLAYAIDKLDLKQLTEERTHYLAGSLAKDVIEGMIEDKTLVDYDHSFKLVYLQKRAIS